MQYLFGFRHSQLNSTELFKYNNTTTLTYGYEYFASLANGLQHNRTIENFQLGAYDLCIIFGQVTSLKEMCINCNRIGEDTMNTFSSALLNRSFGVKYKFSLNY